MKRIHLVNIGSYDDPQYVAAEYGETAARIADLTMGEVEEGNIPLYQAGDRLPEMRTVCWANFFFRPAFDENHHVLETKPGTCVIREGTEEGLDCFVTGPTVQIMPGWRGWSAIATGYATPREARDAASLRFTEELTARDQSVSETRLSQ